MKKKNKQQNLILKILLHHRLASATSALCFVLNVVHSSVMK